MDGIETTIGIPSMIERHQYEFCSTKVSYHFDLHVVIAERVDTDEDAVGHRGDEAQGHDVSAGVGLAFHLIVVSDQTRFGQPFVGDRL